LGERKDNDQRKVYSYENLHQNRGMSSEYLNDACQAPRKIRKAKTKINRQKEIIKLGQNLIKWRFKKKYKESTKQNKVL
jgi:hypothetical protein